MVQGRNGIEATNNVLKRENTAHERLPERLPVGQFTNTVVGILWSGARKSDTVNCIPFHETPSISCPYHCGTLDWCLSMGHGYCKGKVGEFYTSLRNQRPITPAMVTEYRNKEGTVPGKVFWILAFKLRFGKCTCNENTHVPPIWRWIYVNNF